jgi:hypothetical protein
MEKPASRHDRQYYRRRGICWNELLGSLPQTGEQLNLLPIGMCISLSGIIWLTPSGAFFWQFFNPMIPPDKHK